MTSFPLCRSDVLTWLPASVLFVGMIYAGSRALSKLVSIRGFGGQLLSLLPLCLLIYCAVSFNYGIAKLENKPWTRDQHGAFYHPPFPTELKINR